MTNWINFVKDYQSKNNISFKKAMKEAAPSYRKMKEGTVGEVKKKIKIIKDKQSSKSKDDKKEPVKKKVIKIIKDKKEPVKKKVIKIKKGLKSKCEKAEEQAGKLYNFLKDLDEYDDEKGLKSKKIQDQFPKWEKIYKEDIFPLIQYIEGRGDATECEKIMYKGYEENLRNIESYWNKYQEANKYYNLELEDKAKKKARREEKKKRKEKREYEEKQAEKERIRIQDKKFRDEETKRKADFKEKKEKENKRIEQLNKMSIKEIKAETEKLKKQLQKKNR